MDACAGTAKRRPVAGLIEQVVVDRGVWELCSGCDWQRERKAPVVKWERPKCWARSKG